MEFSRTHGTRSLFSVCFIQLDYQNWRFLVPLEAIIFVCFPVLVARGSSSCRFLLCVSHGNVYFVYTRKENSTLSQLASGLQSFKLHFDWLLHSGDQPGLDLDKIKEIAGEIQKLNILEQRQVRATNRE